MNAIWLLNLKTGLIEYANQSTFQLFGYQPEEIIGHSPEVFIRTESQIKFQEEIIEYSLQYHEWEGEIKNYRKNGETFISRLKTFCLKDQNCMPQKLMGIHREIKKSDDLFNPFSHKTSFSEADQMTREKIHEFNNLATIINSYIDFLLLKNVPYESEKDLKNMQNATQRVMLMAKQILNSFSSNKVSSISTNLSSLVDDTLELVSKELKNQRIHYEIMHHQQIYPTINPGQIGQVLLNLILNAKEAMIKSPTKILCIETGQDGEFAFLRVSDSGCGLTEENQEKIFNPFFSTKKSDDKGTSSGHGLGLSIVKRIIENHGGDIKVVSQVGKGTSFIIYLPLISQLNKNKTSAHGERFHFEGNHILIVDDEKGIRELIKKALQLQKAKVDAVGSAKEGWRLIQKNRYDLVLLDLQMPDMPGQNILTLIKDLPDENQPIRLVMTGKAREENERQLINMGAFAVLLKPFELAELYSQIAAALTNAKRTALLST